MCKDWSLAISRKSAPFLRKVVISTDLFRNKFFCVLGSKAPRFWSFAEEATTIAIIGNGSWVQGSNSYGYDNPLVRLWKFYDEEASLFDLHRINEVMYAKMAVVSDVLRCAAALKLGFRTILYHCTLTLSVADIFSYGESVDLEFIYYEEFALEVVGCDTYTLNEAEVKTMDKEERQTVRGYPMEDEDDDKFDNNYGNPVAKYFARKHCTYLEDRELTSLTENGSLRKLGSAGQVRDLVKRLINRY